MGRLIAWWLRPLAARRSRASRREPAAKAAGGIFEPADDQRLAPTEKGGGLTSTRLSRSPQGMMLWAELHQAGSVAIEPSRRSGPSVRCRRMLVIAGCAVTQWQALPSNWSPRDDSSRRPCAL